MSDLLARDPVLARILDAGAIGTWSWNRARDALCLDARAARLLRLENAGEGFAGNAREAFARLHPADVTLLGNAVAEAAFRHSRLDVELRVRGAAGEETRWLQWAGAFLPGEAGTEEVSTCAGIVLDVTEPRRSREEFERAMRRESIGVLAGGISHDFNNILQTLGAHGEILRSGLGPADPRGQSVEEIRRAVERAAGLTRQLLALSRRQPRDERLLLVHTDPGARATIESLLGLFGYSVSCADAPSALRALTGGGAKYDLVVADEASADLLVARLRAWHPGLAILSVAPGSIEGNRLLHEVRARLDARASVPRD